MTSAAHPGERFTFMRWSFDVAACESAIAAGNVVFEEMVWGRELIEGYSERVLNLAPDDTEGIRGLFTVVDVAYAHSLGPTADAAPALMVEQLPPVGHLQIAGKSYFVVNGNHRIAKAYFEGADGIRLRKVSLENAAPYLLDARRTFL